MTDVEEMLRRQTRWQKSRQHLSWPEKIRMAEQVRDSVAALRSSALVQEEPAGPQAQAPGRRSRGHRAGTAE